MTDKEWNDIREAYNFLLISDAINKLEGPHWLVYKCGKIIRIDIKP